MNRSTTLRSISGGIGLLVVAALLTPLAGLLAVTQPVRADTYIISNIHDSGPGSLRQAINDAKNHPGPDNITFAAVTDGKAIVLAGAAGEDANASGDLDILDGGDLTIQGNGFANTIVDGGGIDRVFHICPGGGCTNTVTLTGMTIRNGDAGDGGGIYNQATLSIQACAIGGAGGGNVALNGGGIYSAAGTSLAVDGSTISANGADRGGGIYSNGTLDITNSTIGGASVGNAATIDGGGIYNAAGTTTVDGSTVSDNTANVGGGIFNQATLKVQNGSTIGEAGAPNRATDACGGICNVTALGATTVDGSRVSANEANYCAGIFSQGTLDVQNHSTIGGMGQGNHATMWGGGICNQAGITTVAGSAVTDNIADDDGGGIFTYAGGATTVVGSAVSANRATDGGGIYTWDNNSTTTVDGSTIGGIDAGNIATNHGGGIYNKDSTVIVTGSRILHNTANASGGGVYSDHNLAGATNVSGSCIVGNSDTSFFNQWAAQQIAAGNWWGAATGPNTPGADTVSDDVLYSGFLTAPPIRGCGYSVFLPIVLR